MRRNIYPCELKLGSNTELQFMLHMSVSGVAKFHICSMYWQLVSVDNGKRIDFLPTVNFKGHVSKNVIPYQQFDYLKGPESRILSTTYQFLKCKSLNWCNMTMFTKIFLRSFTCLKNVTQKALHS